MKNVLLYFPVFIILILASCSVEKAQDEQASVVVSSEPKAVEGAHAAHMHAPEAATQTADTATKEGLPKELVCMVNNAFMGKQQYPVQFEDKLYYGCCEMCVNTIKNERGVRVAIDPFTGKEIDKADAFITLKPGSNSEVMYFESEENYRSFLN